MLYKRQLTGGLLVPVVESMTALSVKDNLQLQSGVQFTALANLKEFAKHWSSQTTSCLMVTFWNHVSYRTVQIQHVSVNASQCTAFSGPHIDNNWSWKMNEEEDSFVLSVKGGMSHYRCIYEADHKWHHANLQIFYPSPSSQVVSQSQPPNIPPTPTLKRHITQI